MHNTPGQTLASPKTHKKWQYSNRQNKVFLILLPKKLQYGRSRWSEIRFGRSKRQRIRHTWLRSKTHTFTILTNRGTFYFCWNFVKSLLLDYLAKCHKVLSLHIILYVHITYSNFCFHLSASFDFFCVPG